MAAGMAAALAAGPTTAKGGSIFANEVVSVTGKVMENHAGVQMTEATYWWLCGPADDVVSGWRSSGPATLFTMGFAAALRDEAGADLRIRCYGPGDFKVEAGPDAGSFVEIGQWTTGEPVVFEYVDFDFAGLVDNVQLVRIERLETGPSTGRFFDCFEGTHPVPEPAGAVLMICAAAAALRSRRRRP